MQTTEAMRRVSIARSRLIMDNPFWGALALRLQLEEHPGFGTAGTDGTRLVYDPAFITSLSDAELVGLLAHEVGHAALGHIWRKGGRDMGRWNEACDRVLNPILRDNHFILPPHGLYELDPSHAGKSVEWVYDRLPPQPEGPDMPGVGADWGRILDPPGNADPANTEEGWKKAVRQAAMAARLRGSLPENLQRFADLATEARVDWRSVLHRFVQVTARNDYSWKMPNARFLHSGFYLPSLHNEETGPLLFAIDTSGSVDAKMLGQATREVQAAVEAAKPSCVYIMYCDAMVHRTDTFERDEPIEALHLVGGGGTRFTPVFNEISKLPERPVAVIYLTDLYGEFPDNPPDLPVLWVTDTDQVAPFGETVKMS